jgi:hypothetical protein
MESSCSTDFMSFSLPVKRLKPIADAFQPIPLASGIGHLVSATRLENRTPNT